MMMDQVGNRISFHSMDMSLSLSYIHTCILFSFCILQVLFLYDASGFSLKTIHTLLALELFLLYSSMAAGTIPVFPNTLLWSFI